MRNTLLRKRAASVAAAAVMSITAVAGAVNGMYVNDNYSMSAVYAAETSVKVLVSKGFNEGGYVQWAAVADASGYNVYCDGVQLDQMLIRQYPGYFRADALGLKAGSHTMKVVPVIGGKEDTSKAAESTFSAGAHDRSGYGFVNGTSSGAYNEDGTLKSDAIVVYVTNDNKDSVSLTIPNKDGKETTLTGVQNIITGLKSNSKVGPVAIRFIGNITDPATLNKGDLYVDTAACGLTIEGVGNDTVFNGFGLVMKNSSNVEVRNIGFMNCDSSEGDDCGLQQKNDHIWVHNCDFFYGDAGSDADQVKGDGALDTKTSTYVTHSYNHFWDNGKCNLQGMKSESTENYVTYHHNWYDHSDSRHPRIRTCTVHIYNNYYDGNAKYGVGVTMGASAFVENNYFRNCKYPMLSSEQGSDVATGGTFSGETGGIIKSFGNYIEGAKAYVTYQSDNTEFDAYEASSRTEAVPSSVKTKSGSTGYNNFDTASGFYSYTADNAEDVPSVVMAGAGRVDGGDLQWSFDNSKDDESYAVNQALKDAIVNYKSTIIAVGSGFKEDNTDPPAVSSTTTVTTVTSFDITAATTTTTSSVPSVTPGDVKVLYAGGWNEMAYIVLSGISDSDVTGVSYSGASQGILKGEDLEYLVRDTDAGLRVDLLGLKPGTYSITLDTSKGAVTQSGIKVGAQDRSGFAHFNYSDGVGAYNDNGELKANAKVLYVTEQNKNTVSVTSKDGTTVTGIGNILNSAGQDAGSGKTANGGAANTNSGIIKKLAEDGTPLVVRIIGNVSAPEGVTVFDSTDMGGSVGDNGGMARMKSGKDITIEGVGSDAVVNGWGFHFMAESSAPEFGKSFEVRNVEFRNVPEDCVGMEGVQEGSTLTASVERCWIHNCEFYVPKIADPAESDKAEGDGACDFKRGQYFTNSYCYYEGYHKTNLVGASDSNLQYNLTYHHNYWKSCESRGPLARQANIHMYNNVFDGQTSYCMNPRADAYIFSEYNVFKDSKNPMQVKQGAIKSYNDEFTNVKGDQDGTIVTDKSAKVDCNNKYANFDTDPTLCYISSGDYKLDTTASPDLYTNLKAIFEADGGCMDDMKITPVDPSVSGTTSTTTGGNNTTTTTTNTVTVPPVAGEYVHNFTENGLSSNFYTISGNLSASKGTVTYNGLTLTQCLKLETATSIGFTAPSAGTLTLVFAEAAATIKVDGEKYTSSGDGIITVEIAEGAHTVAKADTANLFYMAYAPKGGQPSTGDITPGDANCDGSVDLADAVLIMQYGANPDTYGLNKPDGISDQGAKNADVVGNDGITNLDALQIQKFKLGIIGSL